MVYNKIYWQPALKGNMIHLAHTTRFNDWVFDPTHPTQGIRASRAIEMLELRGVDHVVVPPRLATDDELLLVHSRSYIDQVDLGYTSEWADQRRDLGELARLIAGASMTAYDLIESGKATFAINFAGAKHHAHRGRSSGFCVYGDQAMITMRAVRSGMRTVIIDVDAHHGDGTEELLFDVPEALTISIHDELIFPGTGHESSPEHGAINFPLAGGSGDDSLLAAVRQAVELARDFNPDLVQLTWGADGHREDPLSTLNYTLAGYVEAAGLIAKAFPKTPMFMGGAGGYLPEYITPLVWSRAAERISTVRSALSTVS